jgi:glutathione peroxidase
MKIALAYFILLLAIAASVIINNSIIAKDNKSTAELKLTAKPEGDKKMNNISTIKVKDMDGKEVSFSSFKGKVLLIVNVASECGFTPQYKGLQQLYEKYKGKGLEILGFPCNDFGGQEPGSNQEIKTFCSANYGVTFKLFDKVKILGKDKNKLYAALTDNDVTGAKDVKWNFEKFLISKDGDIVARFPSKVEPMDKQIIDAIDKELSKK